MAKTLLLLPVLFLIACAEGRAIDARLGDEPGYPVVLATDDPELFAACETARESSFDRIACVDESEPHAALLEADMSTEVERLDGRIMRVTVGVDVPVEARGYELLVALLGTSG